MTGVDEGVESMCAIYVCARRDDSGSYVRDEPQISNAVRCLNSSMSSNPARVSREVGEIESKCDSKQCLKLGCYLIHGRRRYSLLSMGYRDDIVVCVECD